MTSAYGNTYGYDGNGNQTTRTIGGTTYTFTFDYENRLTEVKQDTTTLATFLYDADGNRVKGTVSGTTTVYIAGVYERQGAAYTSYYEGGGLRRSGYSTNNGVFYMLSDHLKSTSALVARNGVLNVKYFYYPYGARRGVPFNTITARHFTGQYHETALPGGEGLSFYNARWYDPRLGRFLSADTIVPNASNPQDLNRFAYVRNNPLRYVDPSGHWLCEDATNCSGGPGSGGNGNGGGGSSNGGGSGGSGGSSGGNSSGIGSKGGNSSVSSGGGNNTFGGTVLNPFQLKLVKAYSQVYGVPWQITAGLLESEILLDTELKDAGENLVIGFFPFFTYVRPNGAGPGVGNVHVVTANSVSAYFAEHYAGEADMQLGWHSRPDWQTAFNLVRDDFNIRTVTAYVRQLADYRFGSHQQPLKTDHSDVANWTISDAVAIWHGYRYGVPGISPQGGGIQAGWRTLSDFQGAGRPMLGSITGSGAVPSALGGFRIMGPYLLER